MRELRNAYSLWMMGDIGEANVVNKGNNDIPHPIDHAISEAKILGYRIIGMDVVEIIPKDKREAPYESPAVLLVNGDQNNVAIVQTPERLGRGRLYYIVSYNPNE